MCINNLFNVTISPIIRPIFLPLVFVIKSAKKNFSIASANSGAAVRIDFCHCHCHLPLSLSFSFSIFSPPISFVLWPSLSRQMSEIRLPFTKNRRA